MYSIQIYLQVAKKTTLLKNLHRNQTNNKFIKSFKKKIQIIQFNESVKWLLFPALLVSVSF